MRPCLQDQVPGTQWKGHSKVITCPPPLLPLSSLGPPPHFHIRPWPQLSWTGPLWTGPWKPTKYWKTGFSGQKGVLDVSSLSSPLPEVQAHAQAHVHPFWVVGGHTRSHTCSLLTLSFSCSPTCTLSISLPQENKDLATKSIWRHSCIWKTVDIDNAFATVAPRFTYCTNRNPKFLSGKAFQSTV